MAKNNKDKDEKDSGFIGNLKRETVHGIYAVLLFVLALFFMLSAFDKAGVVGVTIYESFHYLLGIGYYLLPAVLFIVSISLINAFPKKFALPKIIGSVVLFASGLGAINLMSAGKGGIIGNMISAPLVRLFDYAASYIFLFALAIISIIVIFDTKLGFGWILSLFRKEKKAKKDEIKEIKISNPGSLNKEKVEKKEEEVEENGEKEEKEKEKPLKVKNGTEKKNTDDLDLAGKLFATGKEYNPPPLSLLEEDSGKPGVGDIKANANIIKRTLQNFGVTVEMDEISIGPSVTRYSLKPAEGVKLSRIVALQNDLSLALAAHPLRIEAPIPGKSLVGIEIPNNIKTTVGLGSMLSTEEFRTSEKPLLVALGKSVSGKSHFGNLAKMPHCLIAGTTGSGKSVSIHNLIASLIYRNSPESLKFIMIDPKRVELTSYNKIPHLLCPVITEPKKAILVLKWAAKEMDRRYDILEAEAVRDIESYHKNVLAPAMKKFAEKTKAGEEAVQPETMPYIVVVVDELADIMATYPRELEAAIVRLAQMSRAVGIHLILSTQRPSVKVITGLIKANVPSRIALQVSSHFDSQTILDTGGAEKLLGAGDMLYLSGEMRKPQRLQAPFISEKEVKSVVKYLTDEYKDEIPNEINLTGAESEKNPIFEQSLENGENPADEDDLYEEAREIVIKAGKASTSYIQRKLRVGYARAARLVDMLEERGVVGHADGSKPRPVIGAENQISEQAETGETEEAEDVPSEIENPELS